VVDFMVNEFHSAMLNASFGPSSDVADYIDPQWRPAEMTLAAKAVQRALLVNPDDEVASCWRAYEIRRLLPKTDLSDHLLRFDARTGFELSDLVRRLSSKFSPSITNNASGRIQLRGRLTFPHYRQFSWRLRSDGQQWTLQSLTDAGEIYSGDYVYRASTDTFTGALKPLPGWKSVGDESDDYVAPDAGQPLSRAVVFFPAAEIDSEIHWAAKPSVTLADTAAQLAGPLRSYVVDLAGEEGGRLPAGSRSLLRDIVLESVEPAAKVCAAAILLAGRNLHDRITH
jgi:hypothetical protein